MKGKKIVVFFCVVAFIGFLAACNIGSQGVTSQERPIAGFNAIILDGVGNMNIHPGENHKVVITTNSNLLERVVTTVNNNTLTVTQRRAGTFRASELTIDVYLPELKAVSLSGVGKITINGGNAAELTLSLSGTGSVDAQNFQVQNVSINHSGVGTARIWVTNSLTGTLSGVGNILYRGNPAINVNRTGIGRVEPL